MKKRLENIRYRLRWVTFAALFCAMIEIISYIVTGGAPFLSIALLTLSALLYYTYKDVVAAIEHANDPPAKAEEAT